MKPQTRQSIMLLTTICLITFGIVGCFKTADITGPTIEQLGDAANKQKSATEVIDKEASSIQSKSAEDHSVASAGKIKEANVNLKNNIDVLSQEAEAKAAIEKNLDKANDKIKELEEEDNEFTKWVCRIAILVGTLLTAVGIVIFIKSGFTQWEVGAFGIALTLSASVTAWISANTIWFVLGIGGIALVGVLLWVFLRTDKVGESAVHVSEMLKHEIKSLKTIEADATDDDELYVKYEDVKGILLKIFGDNLHTGQAGSIQTESVSNHITAKRKKLLKKAKSFYS